MHVDSSKTMYFLKIWHICNSFWKVWTTYIEEYPFFLLLVSKKVGFRRNWEMFFKNYIYNVHKTITHTWMLLTAKTFPSLPNNARFISSNNMAINLNAIIILESKLKIQSICWIIILHFLVGVNNCNDYVIWRIAGLN